MATTKVTIATDEVHPKTPGALRIAFSKSAGDKTVMALTDKAQKDYITRQQYEDNLPSPVYSPFVYNLPAGSVTPVIINFVNKTVKIGAASPVDIGADISVYESNPTILFKKIIDSTNTQPIGNEGWIVNELWANSSYGSLVSVTLQPDTDTGVSGGLTLDNINIIIKP